VISTGIERDVRHLAIPSGCTDGGRSERMRPSYRPVAAGGTPRGDRVQYVILAAIAFGVVVVGIDSLRQHRATRKRPRVDAAVATALRAPASTLDVPELVVDRFSIPAAAPDDSLGGIWDSLVEEVDPETFAPKVADDTEIVLFRLRGGNDYAVCARPDHTFHFYLEPWEAELMRLMDGTRTAQELIVAHLEEAGDLDPGAVLSLVLSLHEGGFLDPAPLDVPDLVRDRLDPASSSRKKIRGFFKTLRIGWDGADDFVRACYRGGLRFAFRPPVTVLLAIVALGGLAAFVATLGSDRFTFSLREAPAEAVLLLALGFFLTFCHELAHATVLVHYGRKVISAGFFIFFGSPAFFVDSSDGLMLDRRQRIIQSLAGPFAELALAGIASLVLFFFPGARVSSFLYRFAVLNYYLILLNLIPLLELDGYWVLTDVIQVRDLRPRSLAFVQGDLWHKLSVRERFNRQEVGLALYGTVGLLFTVFSFYTAFFFWQHIFGDIVSDLWHGGVGSRILLLILTLFFAGPAIRGLIALIRAIVKRIRAQAERIRFRRQRAWRIEAAELIDRLPAFEDLPEDVLSDLAGRVTLRSLPPGHAVFRQGDRADAFYVLRRGRLAVEDEHPETGDIRVLRTLEPGESFGELGLLSAAPRSATIRALTDTQVFEIGKATFDRLLADDIHAPEFAPTMQAIAELRGLTAFRRLTLDDLAVVLERGEWIQAAHGDVLVEQGEIGDAFYSIAAGQADVVVDDELINTLGPGDHFGEIALLEHVARTATVVARTPLRAFRLDSDGFDRVVAESLRPDRPDRAPERDMEH
jgi:CRP-like cAMP-binding protein/Zn-dependent protease